MSKSSTSVWRLRCQRAKESQGRILFYLQKILVRLDTWPQRCLMAPHTMRNATSIPLDWYCGNASNYRPRSTLSTWVKWPPRFTTETKHPNSTISGATVSKVCSLIPSWGNSRRGTAARPSSGCWRQDWGSLKATWLVISIFQTALKCPLRICVFKQIRTVSIEHKTWASPRGDNFN